MEAAEVAVTSGGNDVFALVDLDLEVAHDLVKQIFGFVKFKVV